MNYSCNRSCASGGAAVAIRRCPHRAALMLMPTARQRSAARRRRRQPSRLSLQHQISNACCFHSFRRNDSQLKPGGRKNVSHTKPEYVSRITALRAKVNVGTIGYPLRDSDFRECHCRGFRKVTDVCLKPLVSVCSVRREQRD